MRLYWRAGGLTCRGRGTNPSLLVAAFLGPFQFQASSVHVPLAHSVEVPRSEKDLRSWMLQMLQYAGRGVCTFGPRTENLGSWRTGHTYTY